MAKKNYILDDDEDVVIDKKSKRRLAKAREQQQRAQNQASVTPQDDTMSQVALFCQNQRWREALSLCLNAIAKAQSEGQEDTVIGLQMASQKIEYSLRRQMATAFIVKAKELLNKEYLLDVGKQ